MGIYWYTLPATLGSQLADPNRRNLLIGDGSLQLTVQAISTMIREKLNQLYLLLITMDIQWNVKFMAKMQCITILKCGTINYYQLSLVVKNKCAHMMSTQ